MEEDFRLLLLLLVYIEAVPGLSVCGAAGTAEEALIGVESLKDIVVIDLDVPKKRGLDLITDLANLRSGMPVIVFSMHDVRECLGARGSAYVTESSGFQALLSAIQRGILTAERLPKCDPGSQTHDAYAELDSFAASASLPRGSLVTATFCVKPQTLGQRDDKAARAVVRER